MQSETDMVAENVFAEDKNGPGQCIANAVDAGAVVPDAVVIADAVGIRSSPMTAADTVATWFFGSLFRKYRLCSLTAFLMKMCLDVCEA